MYTPVESGSHQRAPKSFGGLVKIQVDASHPRVTGVLIIWGAIQRLERGDIRVDHSEVSLLFVS